MKVHMILSLGLLGLAQASTAKTVGDMISQSNRGGGLSYSKKSATALPSFSANIFSAQDKNARVNLSAVKPPKTRSFLDETDDKAKLERITDEQIQELFKLTRQFKDSRRRGELWLRLAELYVEKSGLVDIRVHDRYEKALKDFQSGRSKTRPKLDLREAREYNQKAIQLYEWFARDFPKDEKMDQALFFLGYNYYELGNVKKGTAFYQRIPREFPRSPFITESHFALAEYYFENEKWKTAQEHYANIVRLPGHRLYGFSLYKSAWCSFRSGNSRKALAEMEKLIRYSQSDSRAKGSARLEIEGLRDIVVIYADIGSPDAAVEYFTKLSRKDPMGYIESLAFFYSDSGQREGARKLFNYLIAKNPTVPKAFEYKYQIVKSYATATKTKEFKTELLSWIRDYSEGSAWYQENKDNKELVESSRKQQETMLSTWTLQAHQSAQKSKAAFSRTMAQEGYKLYLAEFPKAANIGDMHFFFGELLYDMERFDEAAEQYRWVVDNMPSSRFNSKAAEFVVLAMERGLPKDAEISKQVGKKIDPVPLSEKMNQFVKTGEWYLQKFPKSEKVVDIKFRTARLYYQHNQFDLATPMFKEIVLNYPKTKFADYSANLLLDTFSLQKDYEGLEKVAQELLQSPGFRQTSAGKEIKSILEKSNFKKAQDLEIKGDYKTSAEEFQKFGKLNVGSGLAITSFFNAAVNFERAGQTSAAISNYRKVLKSTAGEHAAIRAKSSANIAKLYQDNGMIEEAAVAYRKAGDEAGNDPKSANFYFNAALLNETLGRDRLAQEEYETYISKSKGKERFDAMFNLGEMYRKKGELSKASVKYKDYFAAGTGSGEKLVQSAFYAYEIAKKLNRSSEAKDYRAKTLSLQSKVAPHKKGPGASFAAKIKIEDAEKALADLRFIRIPSNPKNQQRAVEEKITLVNQLNRQLAEIIKYDAAEEIIASLTIAGEANEHMGEALINAPTPAGLTADQQKDYKAGVEKVAQPFLDKAKGSYKGAVEKASELEIYTDEYLRAHDRLHLLEGGSVLSGSELPSDVRQVHWMNQ